MSAPTTPAARPRDAGVSLIEMIVAVALLLVLTTVVASLSILVTRTSATVAGRLDNTSQSELGVAAISKVLRTAVLPAQLDNQTCTSCENVNTAIVTASGTSVTFYANLNNTGQGPSKVTYDVVADPAGNGMLRQTTQPPIPGQNGTYSFSTSVQTISYVARGLTWPTPDLFTYYDYDGNKITSSTLAASDLPKVNSVDVVVTARAGNGKTSKPRTTVTRVRLPNDEINVLVNP